MHIGQPPDHDGSADWADLAQQRLASQQKEQALANQIATTYVWAINRKTGDVSYALNGQVSVIDRGRIVTVLNQDKAAASSDWRWPSRNSDHALRVTVAWSGSGWSRRLRRNKESPSNSQTRRCNTPCVFYNVWRIRANASRKEAAGSS